MWSALEAAEAHTVGFGLLPFVKEGASGDDTFAADAQVFCFWEASDRALRDAAICCRAIFQLVRRLSL